MVTWWKEFVNAPLRRQCGKQVKGHPQMHAECKASLG